MAVVTAARWRHEALASGRELLLAGGGLFEGSQRQLAAVRTTRGLIRTPLHLAGMLSEPVLIMTVEA
jgi:hypothetical protein